MNFISRIHGHLIAIVHPSKHQACCCELYTAVQIPDNNHGHLISIVQPSKHQASSVLL
jgi:hypothetical protein